MRPSPSPELEMSPSPSPELETSPELGAGPVSQPGA